MNGDATSAPPPTPSTHHPNSPFPTSDAASADALSMLLHRLPPTFSLPTRRRSPPATCPPEIPLSDVQANPTGLSSASQLGFFQFANSAESEALSLLDLPKPQKQSVLPDCWPLDFEEDDDDHKDGNTLGESFCMDSSSSTESTELGLASLPKFTHCSSLEEWEVEESKRKTSGNVYVGDSSYPQ